MIYVVFHLRKFTFAKNLKTNGKNYTNSSRKSTGKTDK